MKKLFLFLLPILAFAFLPSTYAQEAEMTDKAGEIVVEGIITNPVNDKVAISNRKAAHKAELVDGKFEIKFQAEKGARYRFAHGNESASLFLEPGDKVKLTIDPNQFDETIQLTGEGASESNYLFSKYLLDELLWEDQEETMKLDPAAFTAKVDKIQKAMMDHFKKHLAQSPDLNKEFMKDEKQDLHYSMAATKVQYPMYHEYLTKNKVKLAKDYLDFAKDYDLNDQNMKGNGTYAQFVSGYISLLAYQQLTAQGKEVSAYEPSPEMLDAEFALMEKKITDEKERNTMQYRGLLNYLSSKDAEGVDHLIKNYLASTESENRKKRMQDSYDSAKRLTAGKPAPDFSYPNMEGTDMSLANFKGRYVYIDMWATWCGPCLKELPHLEELQEKYKNDTNVAFVSVSIDSDKDAWRKMVKEKEMKGFQLIADKAWKSQICSDYGVNGIPRFVLIDREGNLINKNAPRPSSDELKDILTNLLSEDRSSK